jgi:prenyltransferase beta subunit
VWFQISLRSHERSYARRLAEIRRAATLATMNFTIPRGRSLRLEMLQVARLAPKALGDSAGLVRDFLLRQFTEEGGARDRAERADLYYTIFALAGLEALMMAPDEFQAANGGRISPWVAGFGDGEGLDFIHLGALARCASSPFVFRDPSCEAAKVLARIEEFRTPDGGYHERRGAVQGHAYGCFVALGAAQDLGGDLPEPLRMVQCLKFLETPDAGWGNVRGMRAGTVPATAAAVTLLHQLGMPVAPSAGDWLLAQQHESGGWLAVPGAPMPDLLSTATALHALACLECELPEAAHERTLDFVDTLWNANGGFHGHWADDALDAEYTFYGLLALGHLVG